MRRQIVRSTLLAVGLAMLSMSASIGGLIWFAVRDREPGSRWAAGSISSTQVLLRVLVLLVVLSLVGMAVGYVVALRSARRLGAPMAELAESAEALGEGSSRVQAMTSGIPEVDRVSSVLARSSRQVSTSLAAERDFAANASHQLRTPLTALLMRLEEISMSEDIEAIREEAGIAISQVERLTRVVDELLGRARRAADEPLPTVSVDSVIAGLQREWQPAFEQARRSVRVYGERGLQVRATPVALAQILSTLLENSLRHGRGTVELQVRRSGPSVVIEVTDQGVGVDPSLAPRIFERSVSGGRGGTGLGLALARDLAESVGGRLDLIQARPAVFALFVSEADRTNGAPDNGRANGVEFADRLGSLGD